MIDAKSDAERLPEPLREAIAGADDLDAAARLCAQALTHRTWVNEHPGEMDNQRLELLGDAVLGLVVTDLLYAALPSADEGLLSRVRSSSVNEGALSEAARAISLGASLRLGRGERASGGADRARTLADALEAVIGAVYLARGPDGARAFVRRVLGARIDAEVAGAARASTGPVDVRAKDKKSVLQELVQGRGGEAPTYELADSTGPDHDRRWRVRVRVRALLLGAGEGRSRREAEMAAAAVAIDALVGDPALLEAAQAGGDDPRRSS